MTHLRRVGYVEGTIMAGTTNDSEKPQTIPARPANRRSEPAHENRGLTTSGQSKSDDLNPPQVSMTILGATHPQTFVQHPSFSPKLHANCLTGKQLEESRPDFLTIFDVLSPLLNRLEAMRIAGDLQRDFQNRNIRITNLRATSMDDFALEAPILQWREGHDIDVMMFCKISDICIPCSWLMHIGVGASGPNLRNWNRAFIRSSVSNFAHLHELLEHARRVLGLLPLSMHDLMRSCREKCENHSSPLEYRLFKSVANRED